MSALAERQRPAASESEAARLYEEHAEQIFGYCLRRVGSRSDAEDAVQTTFLYALRALRRGVVPECESAWLTTIAKNVCRWQRRTLDRRGSLASDFDVDAVGGVERIDGDEEELSDDLRSALASIPESQQRALVLSEWHGLSSSEVADQLGMSRPATYALLTRARRSMALALTTISRRAALGLATLVYELRSNLKALFGGSAVAKTVAATTLVATVAVGGVSAARAVDGDRGTPPAPQLGVADVASAEAQRGRVSSGPVRRTSAPRTTADGRASGASGVVAGEHSTPASPSTERVVPSQGLDEIVGTTSPDLETLTNVLPEPAPLLSVLPEPPPLLSALPEPPLLPVLPLPTDLLPPAPELPPAPSVPAPSSVPTDDLPALPPLPEPELPSLP